MKIKYLGTSAAEGIPGIFCHCPICEHAREHGGREIRTRAQALINDDLLLDFGPDTYMHLLQHGLDLAKVEICLITHPHSDHFCYSDFIMRGKGFVVGDMEVPALYVYGSAETGDALASLEAESTIKDGRVAFRRAIAYQTFTHKDYSVTPLPAVHSTEEPFIYLVQQAGRALLYAHDTDVFSDEVFDYLHRSGVLLNLVSLDCTQGMLPIDYIGHMNLERNFIVRDRLLQAGTANGDTVFVANHFSHNGGMSYQDGSRPEVSRGMVVSYDGMELMV